jgi:hypothetical protein
MRSSLWRGRRAVAGILPFIGGTRFADKASNGLSFGFFALFQTGFTGGAPPDFAAFGAAIASTHKIFLLYDLLPNRSAPHNTPSKRCQVQFS